MGTTSQLNSLIDASLLSLSLSLSLDLDGFQDLRAKGIAWPIQEAAGHLQESMVFLQMP